MQRILRDCASYKKSSDVDIRRPLTTPLCRLTLRAKDAANLYYEAEVLQNRIMSSSTSVPLRPSRSLSGKIAIVTGAGSAGDEIGNGRAIAILLAEDGASVLCVDRELSAAQRTVEMITGEGKGTATAVNGDVGSEDDCRRIVEAATESFGRLDILVNNVGIMGARGQAPEVDVAEWTRSLEVNVTSMMLMAKYAIPAMRKNDPGDGNIRGSIVNMGSVAGLQGGTPSLLYPTSKGAVVNMTRAMAAQHGREGIRVNCVCPGNQTP